jgi:hypothetical protein
MPEIDRLVTRIYQRLAAHPGSPTVRVLCHSLWELLGATTPKLFRAFELLVPECCLAVWHSESKRYQSSKLSSLTMSHNQEESQSFQDSVHIRGGGLADEDNPPQTPTTVYNINTVNINDSSLNL